MDNLKQSPSKYTGIYRCPDRINNLQIRVKIKEISDVTLLNDVEFEQNCVSRNLKWQEKIFNNFEKQFYSDEKNCITDLEKKYNLKVNDNQRENDHFLFTYVEEDGVSLEKEEFLLRNNQSETYLNSGNSLDEVLDEKTDCYDYKTSLLKAIDNQTTLPKCSTMYIMADMGEYVGENWVKFEHILCIIKYNKEKHILTVFPDFSKGIPYSLQVDLDTTRHYYYYIENMSEDMPEEFSLKEEEISNKISNHRKQMRHQITENNFELPEKTKLNIHISYEIMFGKNFGYDDIFVRYFIDLPDGCNCKTVELLKGSTQTCNTRNEDKMASFGHHFDLILEYGIQEFQEMGIPKYPYIYFEVISRGSWNSFRSEGLTFHAMPIMKSGFYQFNLNCFRLAPDGFIGDLRRYFSGDCTNFNDITWIGIPGNCENTVLNKYGVQTFGTGFLRTRMNIMHQSQAFLSKYNNNKVMKCREKFIYEKLNSSTLVKSVEQVLQAFRKARKNMQEARKNV